MPTWLLIALIVVAVLVAVLFVGGLVAANRRQAAEEARFRAQLEEANEALAAARAEDRGWDPAALEAAAREAHGRRHPGVEIRELHLIQVVDRPGTEDDQALFRVLEDGGTHDVLLGRSDGAWVELAER